MRAKRLPKWGAFSNCFDELLHLDRDDAAVCRICSRLLMNCHDLIVISLASFNRGVGEAGAGGGLQQLVGTILGSCTIDLVFLCTGNLLPGNLNLAGAELCGHLGLCQITGSAVHSGVCRVCGRIAVDCLDLVVIGLTGINRSIGVAGAGGGLQQLVGAVLGSCTIDFVLACAGNLSSFSEC